MRIKAELEFGLMIVSLQRLGSGGNGINITGIYEIGKTIIKIVFWFMTIGMKKKYLENTNCFNSFFLLKNC